MFVLIVKIIALMVAFVAGLFVGQRHPQLAAATKKVIDAAKAEAEKLAGKKP